MWYGLLFNLITSKYISNDVKLGDIVICGSSELKRLKEGTKRWFFTCKKMKILIDYEK